MSIGDRTEKLFEGFHSEGATVDLSDSYGSDGWKSTLFIGVRHVVRKWEGYGRSGSGELKRGERVILIEDKAKEKKKVQK